jgi:hypothetical protein
MSGEGARWKHEFEMSKGNPARVGTWKVPWVGECLTFEVFFNYSRASFVGLVEGKMTSILHVGERRYFWTWSSGSDGGGGG